MPFSSPLTSTKISRRSDCHTEATSQRVSHSAEAGMVTAETAISLVALASVVTLVLGLLSGAVTYLHAQDLSRAAARELSLGSEPNRVVSNVRAAEPAAMVEFDTRGALAAVSVQLPPAGPLGRLGFTVRATTVTPYEPGDGS